MGEAVLSVEQRSLARAKWGNLVMGGAGVLAAWLSHSQAILVDGLFSLIGFAAAIVGARVSASTMRAPDRTRPLGYAADEPIFVTFRALSLLGLVAFAIGSAALNIFTYASGGEIAELVFGPIIVYFVVVGAICFGLAFSHRRAWIRTGRQSDVLRLETSAATFDGVMTLIAGLGLSAMPLLRDGPLGWISPIGDSVMVLALCGLVLVRYVKDFRRGLGELAGVTAPPAQIAAARRGVRQILFEEDGRLVDLSVQRLGRRAQVVLYFDPGRAVTAAWVDSLTQRLDAALTEALGPCDTYLIISEHGRVLERAEPTPEATPSSDEK